VTYLSLQASHVIASVPRHCERSEAIYKRSLLKKLYQKGVKTYRFNPIKVSRSVSEVVIVLPFA
jgi:hypothetical protein